MLMPRRPGQDELIDLDLCKNVAVSIMLLSGRGVVDETKIACVEF